jgi:hypothetical protein
MTMTTNDLEYDLGQWEKLNDNERINIINHFWDPYNPDIGRKTKKEIIDAFIGKTKIAAHQYGIRTFGWTVYMLYLVVDTSRQRVPSQFLGLGVNKGIIIRKGPDKAKVKFNYGGTFDLDLTEKIMIG